MKKKSTNLSTIVLDTGSLPDPADGNAQPKSPRRNAPMPLIKRFQHSLEPDMIFGWKPRNSKCTSQQAKKGKMSKLKKKKFKKELSKIHSQSISPIKIGQNSSRNDQMAPNPTQETTFQKPSELSDYGSRPSIFVKQQRRELNTISPARTRREESFEEVQKMKKIPPTLQGLLEALHVKHEGEIYKFIEKHSEYEFKATDIKYKIPYLDAIRSYSDNYKNAVYLIDYKDVNKIKPRDPVFDIISRECLSLSKKGKLIYAGKDPYNLKMIQSIPEVKKVKCSNMKLNLKSNDQETVEHKLEFDANFECGNLHSAIKMTDTEYHLFIYPDTNTSGHTQWFYFKVSGMKKNTEYTFKIMNLSKKHSAFQKGMNPCVFSTKTWNVHGVGWDITETYNVNYCSNPFNSVIQSTIKKKYDAKFQNEDSREKSKKKHKSMLNPYSKKLYALRFSYKPKFGEDEVFIAFSIPYSYSQCQYFLKEVVEKMPEIKSKKINYSRKELCKTLGGRKVDIIKITNPSKKRTKKQSIVIMARCHPGETVGSFVMEGVLKGLCSKNFFSDYLRDKCVFYIIPMFNPDGVFCGNNRTSLAGVDLNRRWTKPDKVMEAEVFYLKSMILALGKEEVSIFVDLHGHSKKNNSFIYGNTYKRVQEKGNFWQVRFLAKILNKIAPMFAYDSCAFSNQKSKNSTARAVIGKDIGILNCFTLESSFHAFRYFNMCNKCFVLCKYSISDYHAMGDYLCKGIYGTLRAFLDTEDCIEYNPNIAKTNTEVADNPSAVNSLAKKAHQEILDCTEAKVKMKQKKKKSTKATIKVNNQRPRRVKAIKTEAEANAKASSSMSRRSKQDSTKERVVIHLDPQQQKEEQLFSKYDFSSSLLGQYTEQLEQKVNKFVEESKNNEKLSRAYQVVDEDEEEYTDIDEQSDEEDSNSEPSEDNLSEDELQECYQKIKKSRENYYKNAKLRIFSFSKQNYSLPKIKENFTIDIPPSSSAYTMSEKGRIFREPKKMELYKFSLNPNGKAINSFDHPTSPKTSETISGPPMTTKHSQFKVKMGKYSTLKNPMYKKTNKDIRKEKFTMYHARIASKLPELSPNVISSFVSRSNGSERSINKRFSKRHPMTHLDRFEANRSATQTSEERIFPNFQYRNSPLSFGVKRVSNVISNTKRDEILKRFIGKH
ncbi:unnamed protein product [Moneuplotes crassus]|uniref:Peptidase M14 domain-containing protein n=1 Tax=Euplotes crassus TaxID=5936 RepID=A0AAD1UJP3_EUPCR|nr:unnamed protein product [Moneuplotes crassus]